MDWARTARIDPKPEALQRFKDAAALIEGARVSIPQAASNDVVYALIEGPQSVDPAEVCARIPAHWYDEAIVVLAIEPQPTDALPLLQQRLSGAGAPAGIIAARVAKSRLILEFSPRTSPLLVIAALDTELRRWSGTRRVSMLAPLPDAAWASIAAHGLQAPEIAPERILESLLEAAHVE